MIPMAFLPCLSGEAVVQVEDPARYEIAAASLANSPEWATKWTAWQGNAKADRSRELWSG